MSAKLNLKNIDSEISGEYSDSNSNNENENNTNAYHTKLTPLIVKDKQFGPDIATKASQIRNGKKTK